ncbi:hypothetical protein BE17_45310 [Sorangium cellulosum]|uniref:Sel1 repeat family protein n=1 Tax=Sorangium cellulosum TaxID=56 RepID=A0A150RCE5_SORCE|nr:hypothetical protein BE17_45310 [Sorangium cellulosum]
MSVRLKALSGSLFIFGLAGCGGGAAAGPPAPSPSAAVTQHGTATKPADTPADTPALVANFDGPIEQEPVSPEGHWVLSQRYRLGVGVTKSTVLSCAHARLAAASGSADALAWLKAHAEADPIAHLCLGLLYYTQAQGELADKPRGEAMAREALSQLEPRAAAGDGDACVVIGMIYEHGVGATTDHTKALRYYERASAAHNADAMESLGDMYYHGRAVTKDLVKAAALYRQAAEGGSAFGQSKYADVLERGEGIEADEAQAQRWYRKAAEQGSPDAQRNLARMLMSGGKDPDRAREAIGWLSRAAAQNDRLALFDLARVHAEGKFMPTDVPRAKELAGRAAELGNERAKQWLARLAEREKCVGQAETKLFDVALGCADRETLRPAIVKNGGNVQREDDSFWYDIYGSKDLLLDSIKLSVGYTRAGDFAIAEYDFGDWVDVGKVERTIALLEPKYGRAKLTRTPESNLATWLRKDGIVIELERTPHKMFLRYFQPARRKVLDEEIAAQKGEQRRREVAKQSQAF